MPIKTAYFTIRTVVNYYGVVAVHSTHTYTHTHEHLYLSTRTYMFIIGFNFVRIVYHVINTSVSNNTASTPEDFPVTANRVETSKLDRKLTIRRIRTESMCLFVLYYLLRTQNKKSNKTFYFNSGRSELSTSVDHFTI